MSTSHPPLTNITNTCPIGADPKPHQTPQKPRISLDQTASPATPASPDTPNSAHFVTAASTPASLPRFSNASPPDTSVATPQPPSPQPTDPTPTPPPPPATVSHPPKNTWTRPTRPVSPNLHLAAAAATRAAAQRKINMPSTTVKPTKPRPVWPAGHTVPKSPNFRTVGKPLSEFSSRRKAQLAAETAKRQEELHRLEQVVKQRRRDFAKSRTVPKSPAFMGKRKIVVSEPPAKRRFVPNKMPDFGSAPVVRGTTKSKAHAQVNREGGSDVARRESFLMRKGVRSEQGPLGGVRMERTVSKPFGLQGVERHQALAELRMMQMEKEAEEQNRRRTFRPVALREEILDGPTFVPRPKATKVTEARDLLPGARERKERTMAFQRRQQERMAEMEREEKRKEMEKEQKELEEVTRMLKETQFKPRSVPKSHYRPDIKPVACRHPTRMSVQSDGSNVVVSREANEEGMEGNGVADGSPDSWPMVRRSSFFDEVRKSLSPLLWSPDLPASGGNK